MAASAGRNAGFRILDEFVCQAIPSPAAMPAPEPPATPLTDLLVPMLGRRLPSYDGSTVYTVDEVEPNQHVTLGGRKKRSKLPWAHIERVYHEAQSGRSVTPTAVDELLGDRNNWNSSTLCALVLAMQHPDRIIGGR